MPRPLSIPRAKLNELLRSAIHEANGLTKFSTDHLDADDAIERLRSERQIAFGGWEVNGCGCPAVKLGLSTPPGLTRGWAARVASPIAGPLATSFDTRVAEYLFERVRYNTLDTSGILEITEDDYHAGAPV